MANLESKIPFPKKTSLEGRQKEHRVFLLKSIIELDAALKKAKGREKSAGQKVMGSKRDMRDSMSISALFEGKNADSEESEVEQIRRKLGEYFRALDGHLKIAGPFNPNEPVVPHGPKASGLLDPRDWQPQMTGYETVLAELVKDLRDELRPWQEAQRENNKVLLEEIQKKKFDLEKIRGLQQYARHLQEKIEERVAEIDPLEKRLLSLDVPGPGKTRH